MPSRLPLLAGLVCLGLSLRAEPAPEPALPDGLYAEFTTPRGVFTARLDYEKTPLTCTSFVGLAEGTLAPRNGQPFYTGLKWYRVVPNFVLQSGDPTFTPGKEDKPDDPGHPYAFPDEIVPGLHHDGPGVLSMANAGPDTNSSEFFVTLRDTTRLNYLHSVFGRVVAGLDVLPRVQPNDAFSIKILRIGAAARAFRADEASFRALAAAAKKYSGTPEPGPSAHVNDPDHLLPTEPPRARNFNFKLANYERVTGRRIVVRLFAKSPSDAEDAKPGAFMSALAAKVGTARDGILIAYFADEKDWRVWFGDTTIATVLGHAPTAADLAPEGPLHVAKMKLIDDCTAQGDRDFAEQQKAAAPDKQPVPAQHLKLQLDDVVDRLILLYEPKPKS